MKFNTNAEKQTFDKVKKELPDIIHTKCHDYDELYGYKMIPEGTGSEFFDEDIADHLILKLCKAYQFQYSEIIKQIIHILNWRREFNPLSAAFLEVHDPLLKKIGILTNSPENESNKKVITWNLYGQVKDRKKLFQHPDKFIRYRIGLMEQGLRLLNFGDEDNWYMTQVHDYKNVSFWKLDRDMKSCVKRIIAIFQDYYPELLEAKYFVNVPTVLSWVYDVVKAFVNDETKKKFVVLSNGNKLGQYLAGSPNKLYGGKSYETLQEQNVTNIKPTKYGSFLLERQVIDDVD